MKNNIFTLILTCFIGSTLLLSGCSEWLDVKPKSEIKSDVLFETEGGFKDALIGTYLLMGNTNMYGREMTIGLVEAIGQQYDLTNSSGDYYWIGNQFDYSSYGKDKISSVWSKTYNVLANVNNILGNIDQKQGIMHPTNYAIIKGECLGLRAFLHFDLLRLFGYGDLERTPAYLQKPAIPYVTEYSKHLTEQLSEEKVLERIMEDLTQAAELLNSFDPWGVASKGADYNLPNDDKFYTDRSRRFNYYAVRATQARVYLWQGNYQKAKECAEEIIEHCQNQVKWNENMENEDPAKRDLTSTTEYVFGLHVAELFDKVKPYLEDGEYNANYNLLSQTKNRLDRVFEIANDGGSDYRYRYCCDTRVDPCVFVKYKEIENNKFLNSMPLIKKPEVYYIAAECLNQTGNNDDRKTAISRLNTVRKQRNLTELPNDLTQSRITEEILKEYQKEFICEGQIFYYYKRLGTPQVEGKAMNEKTYKLPLPDAEIEIGGRE